MAASEVDSLGLSDQAEATYSGFTNLMGYGAIVSFIVAMLIIFIIAT